MLSPSDVAESYESSHQWNHKNSRIMGLQVRINVESIEVKHFSYFFNYKVVPNELQSMLNKQRWAIASSLLFSFSSNLTTAVPPLFLK